MILKGLLKVANGFLIQIKESMENKIRKPGLYTEEDILKAMESLPEDPLEPTGYTEKELMCKVPKVGTWSMFQYLTDLPSGIEGDNNKFFYAIPCGREYGKEIKIWYIGAYFNGYYEDVFEYYTASDYSPK